MGLDATPATLHEIGIELNVTRERIRQVEAKFLDQLSQASIWSAPLTEKLSSVLASRSEPLPIQGLDVLDAWFSGIDAWPDALSYILDVFCERKFSLLRIDGQTIVCALTRDEWSELLKAANSTLETGVQQKWTWEQARILVEALIPDRASEMRGTLWSSASKAAHFAEIGDGERILTSLGRGVDQVVEAVLTEAETPLHYGQIAELASARAGRPIDVRRAHNAAANVGFLFGPGVYGLSSHFPLTGDEARTVAAEAEEIIEQGAPNRQWHATELCAHVLARGHYFDGKLTPYIVSIALAKFSTLTFLGRSVWTASQERTFSKANRIDVRQAVAALLRAAGRPMSTNELYNAVVQERGVGEHFQIQAIGSMFRLADGRWGLLDRDTGLSSVEQYQMVTSLMEAIEKSGRALHFNDVVSAPAVAAMAAKVPESILRSIIARDGRLRLDESQYVFPVSWDGPRRMTAALAIREALKLSPQEGVSLDQLQRIVPLSPAGIQRELHGALADRSCRRFQPRQIRTRQSRHVRRGNARRLCVGLPSRDQIGPDDRC